MPDLNRSTEPDKNEKRNGEMRLPPRTFLVWIAIIAIGVIVAFVRNGSETPVEELSSFPDLLDKLTNGLIVPNTGHIIYGIQSPDIKRVSGKYYTKDKGGFVKGADGKNTETAFKLETPLTDAMLTQLLYSREFKAATNSNVMLTLFLNTIFPFLLILGALYFFIFRQIKMAGKGAMSFGKSRARMLNKEKNKITFKAVS